MSLPILALAPMAGITDSAFRQVCIKNGADVVYSEMASVSALFFNPQKTLDNIYDFLKIPKNHVLIPEKQKIASYPKIKDETRKFLIDLYKKSNAELFTMIGQTFDWDK